MALVFRVGVVGRCLSMSTARISRGLDGDRDSSRGKGREGEWRGGYVPMRVPSEGSARIPWMIGYENLPSVRSSAKPLLWVYYRI